MTQLLNRDHERQWACSSLLRSIPIRWVVLGQVHWFLHGNATCRNCWRNNSSLPSGIKTSISSLPVLNFYIMGLLFCALYTTLTKQGNKVLQRRAPSI